jgi:hypothetical protein
MLARSAAARASARVVLYVLDIYIHIYRVRERERSSKMPAEPEGAQDAREERRSACQRVMQRREDSRRGISGRLVTDNRQHLVFVLSLY